MKKCLIIAIMAILCLSVKAQKKGYTASNGVTYHIKDTVKLGRGSDPNGRFNYLMLGGWMLGSTTKIGAAYANMGVIIKDIKEGNLKGIKKTYFVVGGGNITNYILSIEDAIEVCEVKPCKTTPASNSISVADELTKLKSLLDSGAITQTEYDTQKKKLLGL